MQSDNFGSGSSVESDYNIPCTLHTFIPGLSTSTPNIDYLTIVKRLGLGLGMGDDSIISQATTHHHHHHT